jgi:hypothetical protein
MSTAPEQRNQRSQNKRDREENEEAIRRLAERRSLSADYTAGLDRAGPFVETGACGGLQPLFQRDRLVDSGPADRREDDARDAARAPLLVTGEERREHLRVADRLRKRAQQPEDAADAESLVFDEVRALSRDLE